MILLPSKTPSNINKVQRLLEEIRISLILTELVVQKLVKTTNMALAAVIIKEAQNTQLIKASKEATKKKGRSNGNLGNASTIGLDETEIERLR